MVNDDDKIYRCNSVGLISAPNTVPMQNDAADMVALSIFVAKGRHYFVRSAHAWDNGTIRVNALTGPRLRSCGLITGTLTNAAPYPQFDPVTTHRSYT